MHDSDHNHLHEEHLRFFGRMTASLSHDINNVFSTINELAGLIHDLDALARQGDRIAPDKIRSLTERISAQVGRGEILIKQLNRFAHAVDVRQEHAGGGCRPRPPACRAQGVLRRRRVTR